MSAQKQPRPRASGQIKARTATPSEQSLSGPLQLIDIQSAAERLGVSVRYVRRLIAERRVEYYKVGRLIRFDATALDAWLERSRVQELTIAPRDPK